LRVVPLGSFDNFELLLRVFGVSAFLGALYLLLPKLTLDSAKLSIVVASLFESEGSNSRPVVEGSLLYSTPY